MTRAETRDGKPTLPVTTIGNLPIAFARHCAGIYLATKRRYELSTLTTEMASKCTHRRGQTILHTVQDQLLRQFGLTKRSVEREPKPKQVAALLRTVDVGSAGVSDRVI